jgi:8-oxo-dGTP pyrophosphatase MutT (NUDIX family)
VPPTRGVHGDQNEEPGGGSDAGDRERREALRREAAEEVGSAVDERAEEAEHGDEHGSRA